MLTTNDTRKAFLEFFARNGHEVMPSSALVPHNDPTLMFSNAGMNQFKNMFTGAEKPKAPRAATSQKCVRAGGKHNDLDNVGYTARHHTFFEMLGNFSFGDYFKDVAIEHAWNFLTKDVGLAADKLLVTVYHTDDEAHLLWKKIASLPDERIIRINTNDNFWSMGDTGPCGPCSEIFYDHGSHIPGGPPGSADQDGDRFIEIWNLVFMQYEQVDKDTRIDLPKPSIDTGMGLERLCAVLQGVHDNYDIDLFKSLIAAIQEETKVQSPEFNASYRVIADHLRSSCFLIADGVMPSNEGRGYVLRRIMRRAMRHAHILGCKEPLMHRLVPALITQMGAAYPELGRAQTLMTENLKLEEERFKQTLDRGLKLLEEASAPLSKGGKLPGETAFKLYDTYGFPLDLTEDILKARGIGVDNAGFEQHMDKQKADARAAWSGSGEKAVGKLWFELRDKVGTTEFLGYNETQAAGTVLAIVADGQEVTSANSGEAYIITNQTPFYGESGGQMGDTGSITKAGKAVAEVLDTQKPVENFHIHKVTLTGEIKTGDEITLTVDTSRRAKLRANHSATHILHEVLRQALGDHVTQKGSLVAPDKLRFDFSQPKALSGEELNSVETKVNSIISQKSDVATRLMSPDDAVKQGAMALFGEKYGDEVRVVSMGLGDGKSFSTELCGGTHVTNTSDIGLFKITSEGSVASGIRRIEAVTGEDVRGYLSTELGKQTEQLQRLQRDNAELLEGLGLPAKDNQAIASPDLLNAAPLAELNTLYATTAQAQQEAINALQDENKKLNKELAEVKKQQALGDSSNVSAETIGAIRFIGKGFEGLDPKELRSVAEEYLKQADVVAVATNVEGKASIVVAVAKTLTDTFSAVTLVQLAVAELGGKGGGGRPEMAQAGGPDAAKIADAIAAIKNSLQA